MSEHDEIPVTEADATPTFESLVQRIVNDGVDFTDAEINQIGEEAAARFGVSADDVKMLLLSGTERFRAAMFEITCKQGHAA